MSIYFPCFSLLLTDRKQASFVHSQLDKMSWSHWMCCWLLWWDVWCSVLLWASQKKLHTLVGMVNAKKTTIYWIKPPQCGYEICIVCSSQCVNVYFVHAKKKKKKVWECKSAGKILHGNAIGWPNYAQNILTNGRDMGFHITGPACTNSPPSQLYSSWANGICLTIQLGAEKIHG